MSQKEQEKSRWIELLWKYIYRKARKDVDGFNDMKVGARIEDFAKAMGLSESTIYRSRSKECFRLKADSLDRITRYLDIEDVKTFEDFIEASLSGRMNAMTDLKDEPQDALQDIEDVVPSAYTDILMLLTSEPVIAALRSGTAKITVSFEIDSKDLEEYAKYKFEKEKSFKSMGFNGGTVWSVFINSEDAAYRMVTFYAEKQEEMPHATITIGRKQMLLSDFLKGKDTSVFDS